MSIVKSLHFNKDDGVDIQYHRHHRSKKGRDRFHRATNFATKMYKRKKEELRYLQLD